VQFGNGGLAPGGGGIGGTRDLATTSAVWHGVDYWSISTDSGDVQAWIGVGPMSRRPRRLPLLWLVPVAVAALTVAIATAAPACARPASAAGQAASSSGCANPVNDTPAKLLPCIRTGARLRHMQAVQAL